MWLQLVVVAALLCLINAQGQSEALHGICHSNRLNLTQDQVIANVVHALDTNDDGVMQRVEMLIFFAGLMGTDLSGNRPELENKTDEEINQKLGSFNITKDDLVKAWHQKFHDSMEFIAASFDVFDTNGDKALNAVVMANMTNTALMSDINHDSQLEVAEFIKFLERIYKNC